MSLKQKPNGDIEMIGIKRFLCSTENQVRSPCGKIVSIHSSPENDTLEEGGLKIKSFYGSRKLSYINPLERKAYRENDEKEANQKKSFDTMQYVAKSKFTVSENKSFTVNTVHRKSVGNTKKAKAKNRSSKCSYNQISKLTKPTSLKKSEMVVNINSSAGSVATYTNKFFRNRSPRKLALLSGHGRRMLINRSFKFQLKSGSSLQKTFAKKAILPKVSTLPRNDSCNSIHFPENNENIELNVQESLDDKRDSPGNTIDDSNCLAIAAQVGQDNEAGGDVAGSVVEDSLILNSEDHNVAAVSKDDVLHHDRTKMFPIFGTASPNLRTTRSCGRKKVTADDKGFLHAKKTDKEQMILDFGQKLIGSVPCSACGMTYLRGDREDEMMHNKYHQHLLNTLKFTGWQKERVVQDFLDGSRVVMVVPDDKFALKKVDAIKTIVDRDLGFVDEPLPLLWKAFLLINEKKIVGFCLAQSISQGFRMLGYKQSEESQSDQRQPFCCDEVPVPVLCGISRIWVLSTERRKQRATKLLDTVRSRFVMGYPLSKEEIAFSDPTPDGIKFASEYSGTQCFLVFRK